MLDDTTVVIPAHNRPERLERLLRYLSQTNATILIPDSSVKPYTGLIPRPGKTTYIHRPNLHFLLKIREILPLISTKYVIYCADDDFIVPAGVEHCTRFLDLNPDFCVAQGHYLTFTPRRNHIDFFPRYIRNFNSRIVAPSGVERLSRPNKAIYASLLYAVVRSSCFKKTYSYCFAPDGSPRFRNLFLAEVYFHNSMLIQGNYATLPVFFSARERIENSATDTTMPISKLKTTVEFQNEYAEYISSLAEMLADQEKISPDEAHRIVAEAVEINGDSKAVNLKRKIVMFASRHRSLRWLSRILDRRYAAKGLKAVASMESYPCTFNTPERAAIIEAVSSQIDSL